MSNDINNLDVNDEGLKAIFGDRFHDETVESGAERSKKQETTYTSELTKAEQSGAQKRTYKDAKWEPAKPDPNWLDKLKSCAMYTVGFGGLSILLFSWQQSGLMDSSVAIPSMCACTALAGWGVGKNAMRGNGR